MAVSRGDPGEQGKWTALVPVRVAEDDLPRASVGGIGWRVEGARLVLARQHRGPYGTISGVFDALTQACGSRGVTLTGRSEHVYVSDPARTLPADLISIARVRVVPTGRSEVGIYAGRGAFGPGVAALSRALSKERISVRTIAAAEVLDGKLGERCETLIVPGGWAVPYKADLGMEGGRLLKAFVKSGGGYLGICAGAFFAAKKIEWEGNTFPYPLDLFPGVPAGPIERIAPWPKYATTRIRFSGRHSVTKGLGTDRTVLYFGGPILAPRTGARVTVLANYGDSRDPAMVAFKVGRGRVILSGFHPEIRLGEDGLGWPTEPVARPDPDSDHDLLFRAVRWVLGVE